MLEFDSRPPAEYAVTTKYVVTAGVPILKLVVFPRVASRAAVLEDGEHCD